MKNRKVLVTGGCGFIGSHLVDRLIKDGAKVQVIDNLSTGTLNNLNKSAKFHKCDIKDVANLAKHFKGVEYVFHTAALARIQPSIKNPKTTFEANASGTLNVLLAAENKKLLKGEIINIGAGKDYSINEVAAMVLKIPSPNSERARKEKLLTYIPPRPAESRVTLASNSKAKKILGWTPKISFERGLELTRAYY